MKGNIKLTKVCKEETWACCASGKGARRKHMTKTGLWQAEHTLFILGVTFILLEDEYN